MTMTDPIADMLTRVRNALQVRRTTVDIPSSRTKGSIALVLQAEGYIKDVEPVADGRGRPALRITLKYGPDGAPAISELRRVSRPGCRIYASMRTVPVVRRGLGIAILSTPKGILSSRKAAELGVGGEVLCTVF